jgi:hypothetical protein
LEILFQFWAMFRGTFDRILFFGKPFATEEAAQYR